MQEKIVKGGMALGLRQLISLPLNLAGVTIVSRLLSPSDFGVFAVLTILVNLAFVVVDMGTSPALVQSPVVPSARLLRQVQWYKLVTSLICTLLFFLLSPSMIAHYQLPQWMTILFVSCASVAWLQSQRGYQSIWLQRRLEWQVLARVEMVEILVYNLILVITAYFSHSPLAFTLSMGGRFLIGAILLKLATQGSKERAMSLGGSFRKLLSFGAPLQANTALSMVQKSMNPIIIGGLAGISAVGLVNWSSYIVALPLLPLQPLQNFLFSIISRRNYQDQRDDEVIKMVIRLGSVLIALVSLVLILLLPFLVDRIFGSSWNGAIPIASILLLGNVLAIPGLTIPTQLAAKGYSLVWMKIVIVETILILTLGSLGVLAYGLIGYAVGMVVASSGTVAIECWVARRLTGLDVRFSDSVRLLLITFVAWRLGQSSGPSLSHETLLIAGLHVIVGVIVFLGLVALTDVKRLKLDFMFLAIMLNFPAINLPSAPKH